MEMNRTAVGKFLYGVLFVVAVPALLVTWAVKTTPAVGLPVIPYSWAGSILAVLGLFLIATGMRALVRHGRGLPMNAFPPPVYVNQGPYRFTSHPIYVGFALLCFGVAVYVESPSGLWLVSPMVALGVTALVLGYERHDLRRRFGARAIHRPVISLPEDSSDPPTAWNQVSMYLLVFAPWSVAFEAVYRLGVPVDGIIAHFPFERGWPVLEWTEAIYGSAYFIVLSAPFIVPTQRALRRMAVMALIATAVVPLIYVTIPMISPPRPFEPHSFLGQALMVERAMSHTVAAFPAFHVIWVFIAADAWAARSRAWGIAGWTWALLITASCITTGMHALVDLVAAAIVFVLLSRYRRLWEAMRRRAEGVANSWREWRLGEVRIINHGLYAALAGASGLWISASLGGPRVFWQLVFVHLCILAGAGLWAQQLEGSSRLSRPFGYYGGVIGGVAGAIAAGTAAGNTLLLLALLAMEGPWVQAIGRMRCLVQGCCHGSEAPEGIGIRYYMSRSRVCTLGGLRGVPLHPTPLYSILANLVIGVILLRLWSLGAALGLIAGAYLMLNGVARFVEESYRGEPQTPIVGGLRLYQWMAVLSLASGIALTMIPGAHPAGLVFGFNGKVLLSGALYGMLTGFALGVDFPASARRFARLAPP